MRYGFIVPKGDVHHIVAMGREAEEAGWDGFFYYDFWAESPRVALGAVAVQTERVRLGAVLTPLPWRRPWIIAREIATLDRLSGGRAILPVGLGAPDEGAFARGRTSTGEPVDRKVRAQLLDEGLEIVTGLWTGEPITFDGEHYHLEGFRLDHPPVQQPRVPIWVVGAWPHPKSMRRALRYDGLLAAGKLDSPADMRAVHEYVVENRPQDAPVDIVYEGRTPGDDPTKAAEAVRPWAEAGVTWWMEEMWSEPNGPEDVRHRIRQGPPRID